MCKNLLSKSPLDCYSVTNCCFFLLQELKGRELRLKFSEKNDDQLETEKEELEADAGTSEGQHE